MPKNTWQSAIELLKGNPVARLRQELPTMDQFLRYHLGYGRALLQNADRAIILYNSIRTSDGQRSVSTAFLDANGVWRADEYVADRIFVRSELSPKVKLWPMDAEEMQRRFRPPEQGGARVPAYRSGGVIGMIHDSLDEIAEEILSRVPLTTIPCASDIE